MWEVSHYYLIFTTLAAVLCCSMISTVFMACSDDDDKTSDDKTKPVGAVLYYRMDVSDDMFAALDLTVEYYDADGKVHSEKMTSKEWETEIRTKLPATFGARLKAQLKADFDVTSGDKFIAEYGYGYVGSGVNAANEIVGTPAISDSAKRITMKVGDIAEWLERHPDGIVEFLWNIDTNGKSTSGSW